LLAAGCRTPPFPADDAMRTRVRLLRIDDTRRDEPAFLDSALAGTTSRADRGRAALTAGRLGGSAHLSALRLLAADGAADSSASADALFALGLLKDTVSVPLASRHLRASGPAGGVLAVRAAWLLGEVGEPARAVIVESLADRSLSATARGALLLAAARLKPVPAAAVVQWATSADSVVAWRAAYALARGRSAAGVRTLLSVAGSPFASVREQAARGLGRALAGDSLRDLAAAALLQLIADPEPRVRVNAVRSLATYGQGSADRVVAALGDTDAGVRLTAAGALDGVLDSTPARWLTAFAADSAFVVQRAVAEGARKRGLTLRATQAWRTSRDWQRRAASVELDAVGAPSAALGRLSPWLRDQDVRVRAVAAGAIAALVDSAAVRTEVRHTLRVALADPDVGVRTAALQGLTTGATAGDLQDAIDAYALSIGDRDNDARLAFWPLADSAIGRPARPLPADLASRLDALPRPADPLERNVAARIPRFAAWRDSTSVARTVGWYLDRAREAGAAAPPVARLETGRGTIELRLAVEEAPLTVHNFVTLARRGYFDGQRFHRVIPNFVAQAGDPRGDGNGGPGYAIRDELNPLGYQRGTLGMALSGPHTGGSQFFITHSPQPHLDGGYTVFGQLLSGGEVLDRIVQGDRIVRITIH
jgi:cyclophilin family peptidyl-prolyl cis-trans isomerase